MSDEPKEVPWRRRQSKAWMGRKWTGCSGAIVKPQPGSSEPKPPMWKPRLVKTPTPIMLETTRAAAGQVETACLVGWGFTRTATKDARVAGDAQYLIF